MTKEEFDGLQRGDIVVSHSGDSYVIEDILYGGVEFGIGYVAVRTAIITHPHGWTKFEKTNHEPSTEDETSVGVSMYKEG